MPFCQYNGNRYIHNVSLYIYLLLYCKISNGRNITTINHKNNKHNFPCHTPRSLQSRFLSWREKYYPSIPLMQTSCDKFPGRGHGKGEIRHRGRMCQPMFTAPKLPSSDIYWSQSCSVHYRVTRMLQKVGGMEHAEWNWSLYKHGLREHCLHPKQTLVFSATYFFVWILYWSW